jgi:hypothetical protein
LPRRSRIAEPPDRPKDVRDPVRNLRGVRELLSGRAGQGDLEKAESVCAAEGGKLGCGSYVRNAS